jgi:rhodanese-related sulfurtransferase
VAQLLMDHGVTDVYYMKGGFEAWRQAGYQLEPK